MSWVAKTLHVSPTGRAKPTGKTYRRPTQRVKYAKGRTATHKPDGPLGLERACHPQALTPTPRNPGCGKNLSQFNVLQWAELEWADFMTGVGLVRTTRQLGTDWMVVKEPITGEPLGFAQSHAALAYRNAAARKGVTLEVYDV